MSMNVCLVGGGNSTHVMAAVSSSQGHKVTILSRQPERWGTDVTLDNTDAGFMGGAQDIGGKVSVTSDAATAVSEADVVVLAGLPVHLYRAVLAQVCPHIKRKGVMLGSVCSYGGFKWLVDEAMAACDKSGKDVCAFGFQSIPWACGTREYGAKGAVFGAKRELHAAVEGEPEEGVDVRSRLSQLTGIERVEPIDFLTCTLWPNNPLFHPTILYGLFADWDLKTPFAEDAVPKKIYGDVTDKSAEVVEQMDVEVQAITNAVRKIMPDNRYLDLVRPLKECLLGHYKDQIADPTSMATILRTNSAYASHYITYKKVEGGVIPDVDHKFFTTDLPYGLCIYKDIAEQLGVPTPTIDTLIMWNQRMVGKEMMIDGKLGGKDIAEAVRPSMFMSFSKSSM